MKTDRYLLHINVLIQKINNKKAFCLSNNKQNASTINKRIYKKKLWFFRSFYFLKGGFTT